MKLMSFVLILSCASAFCEEPAKPPAPPPGWGDTDTPVPVVKPPKKETAASAKKAEVAKPDASKIETQEDLDKYLKALGLTQMGKDPFAYKDVKWGKAVFGNTEIIGQVASWSKDLKIASFTISLFDKDGELLDTVVFNISNFHSGEVKSFKTYTTVDTEKAVKFKVQYENGL